jgi:ribosomal protein L29
MEVILALSDEEIRLLRDNLKKDLFEYRRDLVFRRVTDTHGTAVIRHNIARCETVLNQRNPKRGAGRKRVKAVPAKQNKPIGEIRAAKHGPDSSLQSMGGTGKRRASSDPAPEEFPPSHRQSVACWFDSGDQAALFVSSPCEFVLHVGSYEIGQNGALPYMGPRPVLAVAAVFTDDFTFQIGCQKFLIPVDVPSEEVRFKCVPLRAGEAVLDLLITEASTARLLHQSSVAISVAKRSYAKT